ncbi:MAG: hypothetical protein EPO64_07690 [Nitrospirae bacterium]|nr:MAG: hypothetical protein EPO64_07690 [Nitrospirota bacterium]
MQTVGGRMSSIAWGAWVILPFLLAGCATWTWRETPPLKEATAGQLTELLREREAAIQTMKGLFRLQVKGPGILLAQRVEGAMFYRRPNALRLQGFNHVGGSLFDLVLADEVYRLRLPGQVFTGRLDALSRTDTIGRPLQLSVLAVSGAVGTAAVSKGAVVSLSEDGDLYRLDVLAPGSEGLAQTSRPVRRIWFERQTLQVVQEDRLTGEGEVEVAVRFEDFRPLALPMKNLALSTEIPAEASPMLKPFKVTIQDGQGQGTLQLTFHEIVPNPDLKPEDLGALAGSRAPARVPALAARHGSQEGKVELR